MADNIKNTFKAWLAGFIDGEGCIAISYYYHKDGRKKHYLSLRIAQKFQEPLLKIQEIYGGSVCYTDCRPKNQVYIHITSAKKAERILRDVLPYLTVKKAQAELALKFRDIKRGSKGHVPTPQVVWEEREALRKIMQSLKKVYM